jgi:N-acetylglucosamine-6-phosphate deacetylase
MMAGRTFVGGRVVTPAGVLDGGSVRILGDTIAEVGGVLAPGAGDDVVDVRGAWVLPGFIDMHMHGGGGYDVTSSAEAMRAAVQFHRSAGTTRTLVSLVAAPAAALVEQLGWIAQLAADGTVLGGHLEGPFLARSRCGAQNPAHLIAPDPALLARLYAAADGSLRMMTIAPELPGALDVVRDAVGRGVITALGHSDATYDQAWAAIEAGASVATHLFNGMRGLHHREPGLVGAALAAGLACELINDGVHVHPAMARLVESLVLVTDAIDAAGVGDGEYTLGGQHVAVRDGIARLDTGTLAGSTATMASALRRTVHDSGLSVAAASYAAAGRPAAVLGVADRYGAIAPGLAADLVVLADDLEVSGVLVGGEWSTPVVTSR